jgi:hypothetical protein
VFASRQPCRSTGLKRLGGEGSGSCDARLAVKRSAPAPASAPCHVAVLPCRRRRRLYRRRVAGAVSSVACFEPSPKSIRRARANCNGEHDERDEDEGRPDQRQHRNRQSRSIDRSMKYSVARLRARTTTRRTLIAAQPAPCLPSFDCFVFLLGVRGSRVRLPMRWERQGRSLKVAPSWGAGAVVLIAGVGGSSRAVSLLFSLETTGSVVPTRPVPSCVDVPAK